MNLNPVISSVIAAQAQCTCSFLINENVSMSLKTHDCTVDSQEHDQYYMT